jgi:hypothetical protein
MSQKAINIVGCVIGLFFMGSISHAQTATGCTSLPGTVTPNVQWPQVWQALNQNANCTDNCHVGNGAAGGLDLSSSTISLYRLVSQDSSQNPNVRLVQAGDAKRSLFFQKINCSTPSVGGRMPPGGSISPTLQALIYDWIERGAYGENPDDPASRDFIFKDGAESQRR